MRGLPEAADEALLSLLEGLAEAGYDFVTVTPETHKRVLARRRDAVARDLRDVFGWSLPFEPDLLSAPLLNALERSGALSRQGGLCRSRVRVASLESRLFLHSAFPTDRADAVFFGPDSYRFAAFLRAELPRLPPVCALADIGTGSGVGAIVAAPVLPDARLVGTDINPTALRFAKISSRHAGIALELVEGPGLAAVEGPVDLVVANPPFVADPAGRLYRNGGGVHGAGLSIEWALAAARRIEPGGAVLLYTGSAVVAGRDALQRTSPRGSPRSAAPFAIPKSTPTSSANCSISPAMTMSSGSPQSVRSSGRRDPAAQRSRLESRRPPC